jgi:2-oxoacid:acceptor oxidoreductase delta subunit (pyruvate/2-ketoisovalerate family)
MKSQTVEIIRGGTVHAVGNTVLNKTGGWRTFKPAIDHETCKKCKICSQFCPDGIIYREEGKDIVIDYDFCKGCGICANECPHESITMEREET